ncbi:MAG TPA: hypothetical protein VF585_09980 [Chthoniobacterales bacterium]|jgi:hypothetical protein
MFVNRLYTNQGRGRSQQQAAYLPAPTPAAKPATQEALEVSLSDEGMCFCSPVSYEVGAVLLVDFAPECSDSNHLLRSEAVVVDCARAATDSAYEITVIFTGN